MMLQQGRQVRVLWLQQMDQEHHHQQEQQQVGVQMVGVNLLVRSCLLPHHLSQVRAAGAMVDL